MASYVERVVAGIRDAEDALAQDVHAQQERWQYRLRQGRVWFDGERRRGQRQFKQSIPAFLREASLLNLLTTPAVYSLALPFVLLDLWVTAFQWTCFPVYGIARVRRRPHFAVDRHKLSYLNTIEKAHCLYCSYVNGLVGYVREIAARTEQYWCPIKHARPIAAPHGHYQLFFDYGDAASYRQGLTGLRTALGTAADRPDRAAGPNR